ncbi:hypothetical protein QAD02_017498 [Eretmocerus hayati]|uniref:Uncharacterized protein n=1 Tax=Eretmocerus hayati TaxID=131215 RepID=A0ACC2PFB5_9HYME|nr:hypothetical protein QAD02_017498 [Eretmocerus hayati]
MRDTVREYKKKIVAGGALNKSQQAMYDRFSFLHPFLNIGDSEEHEQDSPPSTYRGTTAALRASSGKSSPSHLPSQNVTKFRPSENATVTSADHPQDVDLVPRQNLVGGLSQDCVITSVQRPDAGAGCSSSHRLRPRQPCESEISFDLNSELSVTISSDDLDFEEYIPCSNSYEMSIHDLTSEFEALKSPERKIVENSNRDSVQDIIHVEDGGSFYEMKNVFSVKPERIESGKLSPSEGFLVKVKDEPSPGTKPALDDTIHLRVYSPIRSPKIPKKVETTTNYSVASKKLDFDEKVEIPQETEFDRITKKMESLQAMEVRRAKTKIICKQLNALPLSKQLIAIRKIYAVFQQFKSEKK